MADPPLQPKQFEFVRVKPGLTGYHQVRDPEDRRVGLQWNAETGKVFNVHVPEEKQRQGIATAMWQQANDISAQDSSVISPRHSDIRSGKGDAWARKVGGKLPERDVEHSYRGDEPGYVFHEGKWVKP